MGMGRKILLCFLVITLIIIGGLTAANAINNHEINEYIDSFCKVKYANQLIPERDSEGNYYFVTDGEFKIMQLTDVHIGGGIFSREQDKKALSAVAKMIGAEKPDLVVVTGDMAFAVPWSGTVNNYRAHQMLIRLMERLGVYWTVTFGSHKVIEPTRF